MSARRVRFKPLFSVLGMVSGILSGLGVLTMLQQAGTVYPTRNVVILAAVLGLVWGIVFPSLLRWRKVQKAVRRSARPARA